MSTFDMSSRMSVISRKTGTSSILRNSYSNAEREKAKVACLNRVRFSFQKNVTIREVVEAVSRNEYDKYNDFVSYLKKEELEDEEFLKIITESRQFVQSMGPKLSELIKVLLSLNWLDRNQEIAQGYGNFFMDLLVAHPSYAHFGVSRLIAPWLDSDKAGPLDFSDDTTDSPARKRLVLTHSLMLRALSVIPMVYDVVLDCINNSFPYFKRPSRMISCYVQNLLHLQEYSPSLTTHVFNIIVRKMLDMDVNAPRSEILETESEDENLDKLIDAPMKHPIAETLDCVMQIVLEFIDSSVKASENPQSTNTRDVQFIFKMFITMFDEIILPSHNTHHIQFLVFYLCSFKTALAKQFLELLWNKINDPNLSSAIRQASAGYLSGFLARAKYIPEDLLKEYLMKLCSFAHNYIQRCDSVISNSSLKANVVFYSVCQAVFYLIAFRSRDLTNHKKNLVFLQTLQLSGLVSSNLNPLRVCLPDVATAFASVTRSHQLAYCHTILEKNARRRLATVYDNDMGKPQEYLETFFPFDPYLLEKSGKYITPIYVQYQFTEAEERIPHSHSRKRTDSFAQIMDDIDDFIVDKKLRLSESENDRNLNTIID